VCKRLKVKVNADAAVPAMERALLQKIADEAFEKMTVEDLGEFVRENARTARVSLLRNSS
jgi:uncharacterized protein YaaW (UPF0174 family)